MTPRCRCPICESPLLGEGELCPVCLLRGAVAETGVDDSTLGRSSSWRLISVLDANEQAMVYLVERGGDDGIRIGHLHLSRIRASKPGAAERIGVERRRLLALRHQGLVPVVDAGLTDSAQIFVVYEHVQGRRLGDFVAARPRAREEIDRLFLDLSVALDHAHAAGLAHGDVSASTVIVVGARLERRASLLGLGVNHLLACTGSGAVPTVAGDMAALEALRVMCR